MKPLALRLLMRTGAGLLLVAVGWRTFGAIGLVLAGSATGLMLAPLLFESVSALRRRMREHVWRKEEGHFYAYKGRRVRVIEDASHCRWVSAADVREIVGFTASEGALALSYPSGSRKFGSPPEAYLSDEALIVHLAKESGADAIRFKNWAEREISFPAQRLRKRFGVRLAAPDREADD